MYDLSLDWSGDLSLSPTGGLELSTGANLTRQRLIRRLLTNPGDLLEDLTYGAGLAQYIGLPVNAGALQALIEEQCLLEDTVESVSSVKILTDGKGFVSATISYVSIDASEAQSLTLPTTT
ncbi:phage tail protein [Acidisoma cellulosilytica]|uniref:Phage tail protein n=1 Tax=Acidisoma cellulosilyticum TaxID=2802395 RepID=A0A964E4T6_9PROT|nr:phage tail protein [Acidisoma cellulosilyticum]MCB8881717.1 phage tail protein [Acidisoma cellulosilyticum]